MTEASASPQAAENGRQVAATQAVDLAALVMEHHAVVYRYACRLSGSPNDAEDLSQQTFLIAQQKVGQLRQPESARAWLLAVVRSCFLKSLRKSRPIPAQDLDLAVEDVAAATPEVDEVDRGELAEAVGELPDEFRLVVLMFYFEDLSYQEIAEQLEVPIGTVMSRLSRAKGYLRRRLIPPEPKSETIPSPHRHEAKPTGVKAGISAWS
jgi:RNA polymerase sigma-70 factor (ECF subfamily)